MTKQQANDLELLIDEVVQYAVEHNKAERRLNEARARIETFLYSIQTAKQAAPQQEGPAEGRK